MINNDLFNKMCQTINFKNINNSQITSISCLSKDFTIIVYEIEFLFSFLKLMQLLSVFEL